MHKERSDYLTVETLILIVTWERGKGRGAHGRHSAHSVNESYI